MCSKGGTKAHASCPTGAHGSWSCFHLAETTVQVAPRGVVLHAAGVRQQLGDELRSTLRVFRGQKIKLLCDNEGEKKNTRWFDRVHVSVTPRKVTFDS